MLNINSIEFKTMQPKTIYETSVFMLFRDYLGNQASGEYYQNYENMNRRLKAIFPELIEAWDNAENLTDRDIAGFFYLDEEQDKIFYGSTQEELKAQIGQ